MEMLRCCFCTTALRSRARFYESIRQLWFISSTSNGAVRNGVPETPMLRIVLMLLLLLLLIGSLPTWGYSSGWGYYPSGGLGLLLIVVVILALMNRGARTL